MAFTTRWNSVGFNGAGLFLSGDSRVYNINWGDGASTRVVLDPDRNGDGIFDGNVPAHFYASDGTYDVSVSQAQAGLPPEHLKAFLYANATGEIDIAGSNLGDIITGGAAGDRLNGAGGSDLIAGGDGDDRITGGAGDFDVQFAGAGNDVVLGGAGTDLSYGDQGDDVVHGGAGTDFVHGDAGNDVLFGDEGDDYIQGDAGVDRLTGGAGADTFVIVKPLDSQGNPQDTDPDRDTITDFEQGADRIDVSNWVPGFSYVDHAAFSAGGAPELRSGFTAAGDTIVFGDANGDGTADFSIRLLGHIDLTPGDFVI